MAYISALVYNSCRDIQLTLYSSALTYIVSSFINIHAEIAQLVERRTENPCVRGSNPRLGTRVLFAKCGQRSGKMAR